MEEYGTIKSLTTYVNSNQSAKYNKVLTLMYSNRPHYNDVTRNNFIDQRDPAR